MGESKNCSAVSKSDKLERSEEITGKLGNQTGLKVKCSFLWF